MTRSPLLNWNGLLREKYIPLEEEISKASEAEQKLAN
jgi:hypothetical protein